MKTFTGDKFKVKTPDFSKTFGQGNPPEGLVLNLSGEKLDLAWGESIEADEFLSEISQEISGTRYVRTDIIDLLMQGKNPSLKCTKRANENKA